MATPMTIKPIQGLFDADVRDRRAKGQGNHAPPFSGRTYGQILRANVFTFINTWLFVLGILLLVLGHPLDAFYSAGVVLINAVVSSAQELRAKRNLDRIAFLMRPTATVIRAGQERTIPPHELVLGDVLIARSGDQIVVDGRVIGDGRMQVDESQLTGESDAVLKQAGDPVFSGSFCVSGHALYVAEKVGTASLVYELTAGARAFRQIVTPLQRIVNIFARGFVLLVLYLELLVFVNALLARLDLTQQVQNMTVVADLIPTGLFLSVSVTYAISALRIVRSGALVQQSNAIESLSNVDILCLDKTGTLTANRLHVDQVVPIELGQQALEQALGTMVASMQTGNATSDAIRTRYAGQAAPVVAEIPFSSARKWSAVALADSPRPGIYALGAPEFLRPYLHSDPTQWAAIAGRVTELAGQGQRVLLLAQHPDPAQLADHGDASQLPAGMTPLGLVSLRDELRPEAEATLQAFIAAGVQPKIISGDDPQTVTALARQAGLGSDLQCVSGPELEQMTEAEFAEAAATATIFGRITPQQKQRLVRALRERGHYVAMIGDGVNDVLSLKQAQLGIAMQSGSQAARSVADIVLVDDTFAALVPAVQEGQRIVNGMHDVLKLFLTRMATAALVIMSVLVTTMFPMTVRQMALLAFLSIGVPAPLIALWARPGKPAQHLVRNLFRFMLPAALLSSMAAIAVFLLSLWLSIAGAGGLSEAAHAAPIPPAALFTAQTALVSFLLFTGLLLVVFVEPPARWWAVIEPLSGDWRPTIIAGLVCGAYCLLLASPWLRGLANLAALGPAQLGLVGGATLLWLVVVRWIWQVRAFDRWLNIDESERAVKQHAPQAGMQRVRTTGG